MNDLITGGGPTAGRRIEPNIDTTVVALGAWHRIEVYTRYSSCEAAHVVCGRRSERELSKPQGEAIVPAARSPHCGVHAT